MNLMTQAEGCLWLADHLHSKEWWCVVACDDASSHLVTFLEERFASDGDSQLLMVPIPGGHLIGFFLFRKSKASHAEMLAAMQEHAEVPKEYQDPERDIIIGAADPMAVAAVVAFLNNHVNPLMEGRN